jgi:hypothetical protein
VKENTKSSQNEDPKPLIEETAKNKRKHIVPERFV